MKVVERFYTRTRKRVVAHVEHLQLDELPEFLGQKTCETISRQDSVVGSGCSIFNQRVDGAPFSISL